MATRKNSVKKSVDRKKTQLWGAPSPEKFKDTREGKALTRAARIHFTKASDQNHLLAVEKLALDVLSDPLAARAFAVNPDEYLRQMGFSNVKLDLNSQEVRAAMAMGDSRVREAANRGDVTGFIDAVTAQGIAPSTNISAFAAVELAVWSSAIVITVAVVIASIKVIVSIPGPFPVVIFGPISVPVIHPMTTQFHKDTLAQIANHIGDAKFAKEVHSRNMERLLEEYRKLIEESSKTK
ncbi:MAG: hypothetical protein ACR2HX_09935 [Pyrinomonadaceae bacterium]